MSSALVMATLSGVLCALSFPKWEGVYLEPLAWVALVPLLLALERCHAVWRVSAAFALAFQMSNLLALTLLKGPWVLMLMVNAPGLMAFPLIYAGLRRWLPMGWALSVWIPAAVVAEFIHLTAWPPNAPWWQLGASQARLTPVIQLTAWTGPWGLTAWLLLVNGLALMAWRTRTWRWLGALIAGWVVPWCVGTWVLSQPIANDAPERAPLRIAAVSTGIPSNRETDRVALALRLSEPAARTRPDLIVWPEGVSVPGLPDAPGIIQPLQKQVDAWQTPLLLSGAHFQDFQAINQTPATSPTPFERASGVSYRAYSGNLVLIPKSSSQLMPPLFQAKRHMVPFQEFMPWSNAWPGLMAQLSPFALHGRAHWFTPGELPPTPFQVPVTGGVAPLGATLCFELLFPHAVAELVNAGAQVLIWQTNDEDAENGIYAFEMAQFARLRAVETGREIIRVNTDGRNFHVDSRGRMSPSSPPGAGQTNFSVFARTNATPYVRDPHAFLMLCAAGVLLLLGIAGAARRRGRPNPFATHTGRPLL